MADETNIGEALDWDMGEASGDGAFQLLPAGIYAFGVDKFEKERFEGSAKMAPCPRAHLTLSVVGSDGTSGTVHERLMLNTKVLWRVAKFFESLGFPKNDDGNVRVAWNEVEGKGGYLKLKVREYTKKDGSKGESNEVEEFLAPGDPRIAEAMAPAAQRPQQAAMPVPPQPAAPVVPHQGWSV